MSLSEWQIELRRQAAVAEQLKVKPISSACEGYFAVSNPVTTRRYSVVFRGVGNIWNYCSCTDFKTNQLGTCKHIEAVALANVGRYANKTYQIPDRTTIYLDYMGERRVRVRPGGEHMDEILPLINEFFDDDNSLRPEKYAVFGDFISKVNEIDHATRCYSEALKFIVSKREEAYRNNLVESGMVGIGNRLQVPMLQYQKEGAEFAFRKGRCIIADEPGLDKPIQALACAMSLNQHGLTDSVWIVCPSSLKYQWKHEIKKLTGMDALVVDGDVAARADGLADKSALFKVVSYRSLFKILRYGAKAMPGLIIYDEVQRLKDYDVRVARTMRLLKSDYVIALSGIPLQNDMPTLFSVMQLVNKFALGPYWKFINEPVQPAIIDSVMIRRTKKMVESQIPARIDKKLYMAMTREQRAVHQYCKNNLGDLITRWRKTDFLSERDRMRMIQLFSEMRMVCDSTFVFDQKTRHDTKIDEVISIVAELIASANDKIVIFSQWERMLRIIAEELEKQKINFRFMHGGLSADKRSAIISDFTTNPDCRVFLATDAASRGLRLNNATIVINLDLPWNPAVLQKRIDRVHSPVQGNHVYVLNLVSVNTIESVLLESLALKAGLFNGVVDGGDESIALDDKKFNLIADSIDNEVGFSASTIADEDENIVPSPVLLLVDETSDDADDDAQMAMSAADVDEIDEVEYTEDYVPDMALMAEDDANLASPASLFAPAEEAEQTAPAAIPSDLATALATPETINRLVDAIAGDATATDTPLSDKAIVSAVLTRAAALLKTLPK